jgi:hypothetical protein
MSYLNTFQLQQAQNYPASTFWGRDHPSRLVFIARLHRSPNSLHCILRPFGRAKSILHLATWLAGKSSPFASFCVGDSCEVEMRWNEDILRSSVCSSRKLIWHPSQWRGMGHVHQLYAIFILHYAARPAHSRVWSLVIYQPMGLYPPILRPIWQSLKTVIFFGDITVEPCECTPR